MNLYDSWLLLSHEVTRLLSSVNTGTFLNNLNPMCDINGSLRTNFGAKSSPEIEFSALTLYEKTTLLIYRHFPFRLRSKTHRLLEENEKIFLLEIEYHSNRPKKKSPRQNGSELF